MSFSLLKPACASILMPVLFVFTLAQAPASKTTPPSIQSAKDRERALALLDQIQIASSKFSDRWLQLKAKNQIAETLWDYDKARARRLFEEAFRGADSLVQQVGQGPVGSTAPDLVNPLRFEIRKEILQSLFDSRRGLAETLAASIQSEKPYRQLDLAATIQLAIDRELVEHNLAVALNIVQSDPQRAARLARDSLNRIISYNFTKLIRAMRVTNPTLADQLFLDALAALRNKPTYISNKIGILAPYVFPELNGIVMNFQMSA
jgi:hypothetical protein